MPKGTGLLIAGREHYFDSILELRTALGLPSNARVLTADNFTEEQVQEYLRNRQWDTHLPDWLPRRPLMIGYFAGRRLFPLIEGVEHSDPGAGWDALVEQVCLREARAEIGIDHLSVRKLLERLATSARSTPTGLGPLSFGDLVEVFRGLFNYAPDEGAYSVLQRLPGLRATGGESNDRYFVDDDFVDAARSGDVRSWIENPYDASIPKAFQNAQTLLGSVGLAVLQHQVDSRQIKLGAVTAAMDRLGQATETDLLRADLLRLALSGGSVTIQRSQHISNLHVPILSIGEGSDSGLLEFQSCIIDVVDITEIENIDKLPTFRGCAIGTVRGIAGIDDLGIEKFVETEVGNFEDSTDNMNSILQLDVSDERRVVLVILRKVFVQSGHSRKESALYRGSLSSKQRELVPRMLEHLQSAGAIRKSRRRDTTLWAPNLALYSRVRRILDMPATSVDELVAGL